MKSKISGMFKLIPVGISLVRTLSFRFFGIQRKKKDTTTNKLYFYLYIRISLKDDHHINWSLLFLLSFRMLFCSKFRPSFLSKLASQCVCYFLFAFPKNFSWTLNGTGENNKKSETIFNENATRMKWLQQKKFQCNKSKRS